MKSYDPKPLEVIDNFLSSNLANVLFKKTHSLARPYHFKMRIPLWVEKSIEHRNSILATNSAEQIYRRMCCEEKAEYETLIRHFEIDRTIVQKLCSFKELEPGGLMKILIGEAPWGYWHRMLAQKKISLA